MFEFPLFQGLPVRLVFPNLFHSEESLASWKIFAEPRNPLLFLEKPRQTQRVNLFCLCHYSGEGHKSVFGRTFFLGIRSKRTKSTLSTLQTESRNRPTLEVLLIHPTFLYIYPIVVSKIRFWKHCLLYKLTVIPQYTEVGLHCPCRTSSKGGATNLLPLHLFLKQLS